MTITIRGVTYSTQVKAGEALGVNPNSIYMAKKAGTLDTVGLGNKDAIPVKIGHHTFPSITQAAKACGITTSGVTYHLNNGTMERLARRLD